jgi:hypothetical protein
MVSTASNKTSGNDTVLLKMAYQEDNSLIQVAFFKKGYTEDSRPKVTTILPILANHHYGVIYRTAIQPYREGTPT